MPARKLDRRESSPTPLKRTSLLSADNCSPSLPSSAGKRRKTAPATSLRSNLESDESRKDDTIDPVEKLLGLTSQDTHILLNIDDAHAYQSCSSSSSYSSICSEDLLSPLSDTSTLDYSATPYDLSYNFAKVLNDNLQSYYSLFSKSQMEIHNDHSLFAVLNKPRVTPTSARPKTLRNIQVPFFKNVNFNSSPNFGSKLEDYIDYKDICEESNDPKHDHSVASAPPNPSTPLYTFPKNMSFHYRKNDGLNLSLTDEQSTLGLNNGRPILNARSILSGQASETLGPAKFMIREFFF